MPSKLLKDKHGAELQECWYRMPEGTPALARTEGADEVCRGRTWRDMPGHSKLEQRLHFFEYRAGLLRAASDRQLPYSSIAKLVECDHGRKCLHRLRAAGLIWDDRIDGKVVARKPLIRGCRAALRMAQYQEELAV